MASTDARPVPIKAAAYRVYFVLLDDDGDAVTGASGLDSEVSLDGAAFSDCTNEATEIGSSGAYYLDLTSGELTADAVVVQVKTSTVGAKTTTLVLYPQEADDIRVSVTHFGGSAGTFSSGRPEVNTTHAAGTAWGSGAITADSIAADAITDAKVASDVTIASVTGAVGSVTGNVGGNVTGSVGSVAANGISATSIATDAITAAKIASDAITAAKIATGALTAAKFAAGAIDAAALAADAGTEIGTAVWATAARTLTALDEDTTTLDLDATIRAAVGLASANLDTQLSAIESQTDDIGTAGAGLTAVPWNAAWDAEVQSEVQDAIEANHLDHLLATAYDPASKPGAADALLNELVESDAGVARFTANSLEQGPSGGGGVADWTADERTALRSILGIPASGTTPDDPSTGILDTIRDRALAIEADTQDLQSRTPAGLVSGRMDASVGAMAANVMTAAAAAADLTTELQSGLATSSALSTVSGLVDDLETRLTATRAGYLDNLSAGAVALQGSVDTLEASAAAIEADTQDIQARIPTALVGGRIDATVDNIGLEAGAIDAFWDEPVGDGTITARQALRIFIAGMAGKVSGAATTTVTIRNVADTANVVIATVDASGNRTATTVTP